ncbi:MAG: phosphoenolpyruvate synthase, partial [Methylocystis sp.]|nr:phosphoenolpyruvate synthase [Methylocystis sp.]
MSQSCPLVVPLETIGNDAVGLVGGKNASLGELIRALGPHGIQVPNGFATTAAAYWKLLDTDGLHAKISAHLASLRLGKASLEESGAAIRRAILAVEFSNEMKSAIVAAYRELAKRYGGGDMDVAVRSSAAAEDLPEASFAGQQESFLNVRGETELLDACRRCYASLFTDRAISYRNAKGFDHLKVALSIGVQRMVRSDLGGAGVMFSIDTETGFDKVVLINAAWGLGENVVQGAVDPDEYQAFKPLLSRSSLVPILQKKLGEKAKKMVYAPDPGHPTRNVPTSKAERAAFVLPDGEILTLARWACVIEDHYGRPMDIEWAKDGESGELFIVQARPETVQSRKEASAL